jgi:hypothetical protein
VPLVCFSGWGCAGGPAGEHEAVSLTGGPIATSSIEEAKGRSLLPYLSCAGVTTELSSRRVSKMSRKVEFAPVVETELRVREVQLLLNVIEPDPEYQAFAVTDDPSALDVSSNSRELVRARLEQYLRRPLPVDLRVPLWQLVDAIRRVEPASPDAGIAGPD